jgi:hypothetical protein
MVASVVQAGKPPAQLSKRQLPLNALNAVLGAAC